MPGRASMADYRQVLENPINCFQIPIASLPCPRSPCLPVLHASPANLLPPSPPQCSWGSPYPVVDHGDNHLLRPGRHHGLSVHHERKPVRCAHLTQGTLGSTPSRHGEENVDTPAADMVPTGLSAPASATTGHGSQYVSAHTPGTYVLRITDAEGAVSFTRFVKEP